jgi:hypothetical protein
MMTQVRLQVDPVAAGETPQVAETLLRRVWLNVDSDRMRVACKISGMLSTLTEFAFWVLLYRSRW